MVSKGGFAAVEIGNSVAPDERMLIIAAIRERAPSIPIIFVYEAPASGKEPAADFAVKVSDPVNLVHALQQRRAPQ